MNSSRQELYLRYEYILSLLRFDLSPQLLFTEYGIDNPSHASIEKKKNQNYKKLHHHIV